MSFIKKLAFLPITFALAACTQVSFFVVNTQASLSSKHVVKSDIAYGDLEYQKLDVYTPKNVGKDAPVIVFFYGGGWTDGKKEQYQFAAEPFTSKGYVVVVPDYSKYPEYIYPTFIEDAALVTKWVDGNIAEYGGSADKIALMGHSAGAHMVAMLATNPAYLGDERAKIKAVVGLSGPYDFIPQEQIYKDIFAPAKEADGSYKTGMPATYVDGTQSPMLLIYGKKDDIVAMINLTSMQNAIAEKGGEVEVKIYDDMDHIDTIASLSLIKRNDDLLGRILDFLKDKTQ